MCFQYKYDCVVTCLNSKLNTTAFIESGLQKGCELTCGSGVYLSDVETVPFWFLIYNPVFLAFLFVISIVCIVYIFGSEP